MIPSTYEMIYRMRHFEEEMNRKAKHHHHLSNSNDRSNSQIKSEDGGKIHRPKPLFMRHLSQWIAKIF